MTHETNTVRLVAVGDLQLGDSATCVGFGFRSRVSAGALRRSLAHVRSALGEWDLAFGNLETPLSDLGLNRLKRQSRELRGAPEYAAALRAGGFTSLNVANNHALEHGREAFLDSVSRLESEGLAVCGRRGTDGWSTQPAVRVVKGLSVGFLGYCTRPVHDASSQRLHAGPEERQILDDVRRLRGQTDCTIVSLHWGEEFVQLPSAGEVTLAHSIVDAGASVVLGHHPHVARPVERYRGAVIAYSLGNFAADMIWYGPLRRGLILDCELTARGLGKLRVYRTLIEGSFLPCGGAVAQGAVSDEGTVHGLPEEEYIRQARGTVRSQRLALYLYTLRNAWQFDPRVLLELAASTLGGKVSRLSRGDKDEIWG